MLMDDVIKLVFINLLLFAGVFMFVRYGWATVRRLYQREWNRIDRVINGQLLLDLSPHVVMMGSAVIILMCIIVPWMALEHIGWGMIGGVVALFLPNLIIRHLEIKRRRKLEAQLVDGITTLAAGVRAGLTLVQSMELLAKNLIPPISQEFAQLLREYQMGLDLNQAMRNAANRVGSSHYRLVFTAVEMHRLRGGDTGESLDRIAESIREIQRLEGKLDALTAQGRTQALMMACMPLVILAIYYLIDPGGVAMLFSQPLGRIILLFAAVFILIGFLWIRRIMAVDI